MCYIPLLLATLILLKCLLSVWKKEKKKQKPRFIPNSGILTNQKFILLNKNMLSYCLCFSKLYYCKEQATWVGLKSVITHHAGLSSFGDRQFSANCESIWEKVCPWLSMHFCQKINENSAQSQSQKEQYLVVRGDEKGGDYDLICQVKKNYYGY